jgi:hypothetical protein
MEEVCEYLEIDFDPETVLTPTKVGQFWSGNSAARINFSQISTEPVTRWERELSEDEIGWVEWHCRDLMPEFGYEPRLSRRELRYFVRPDSRRASRESISNRERIRCATIGFEAQSTRLTCNVVVSKP